MILRRIRVILNRRRFRRGSRLLNRQIWLLFPRYYAVGWTSSLLTEASLPKPEIVMWLKIATGLAVLAGSWIALYAFRPNSWKFIVLYLLGGFAQTFILLNIAADSNFTTPSRRIHPSTRL